MVDIWNADIDAAPRGHLVLAFVLDNDPISMQEFCLGVPPEDAQARGYPVVGRVIFPRSKRPRRKDGLYNFKAFDGRGTEHIATHWITLPEPPK